MSTITPTRPKPDEADPQPRVHQPGMTLGVLGRQALEQLPQALRKLDPRHLWR